MKENLSLREQELESGDIKKLIVTFAVPAIISNLVSSLYNIADQVFIGQYEGFLGNAATNVTFPLITILTGLALWMGIGAAAKFNLEMGRKNSGLAKNYVGNGIVYLLIIGFSLMIITLVFLEPLMLLFGATKQVMPYALTYTRISAFGFPALVLVIGGSQFIRSDGSPKFAMVVTLSGAILNTILNPIFIFGFDWGIAGGAWATVIGQSVSALLVMYYFFNFKMIDLEKEDFKPKFNIFKVIAALGSASAINQMAMALVQTVSNNALGYYGALSIYGADIPLAVVGVGGKVNTLFLGFLIGIVQGVQPIIGYNYGAKKYDRVKETLFAALKLVTVLGVVATIIFQVFPRQIISLFGKGNDLYFEFGVMYLRIFLMFTIVNGIQIVASNYFTSVGKSNKGIFISLTRQVIFLLPLMIILPIYFGVVGVLYSGPIADFITVILAVVFLSKEVKQLNELIDYQTQ